VWTEGRAEAKTCS